MALVAMANANRFVRRAASASARFLLSFNVASSPILTAPPVATQQ